MRSRGCPIRPPRLELVVTVSLMNPAELSLRLADKAEPRAAVEVKRALLAAGFRPGDRVVLTLAGRGVP